MGSQTWEKPGETSEIVRLSLFRNTEGACVGNTERVKNVARRIAKFPKNIAGIKS